MKDFSLSELRRIDEAYLSMLTEAARIGKDGFDTLGFDKDGYDRFGKNLFGINRSGYDDEGYDILGFNSEGWSKDGWPSPRLNPEAYGLKPEEVEDWIKSETEKRMARGRSVLMQRKSLGRHAEGSYVDRIGNRKRTTPSPEQKKMQELSKKLSSDVRAVERKSETEKRRVEKAAYLASEAGQAELQAKRDKAAQMRKTDEFRTAHAEYQKDYERARRILDGKRMHRLTVEDLMWMSTNPIFKRLKAKKEEVERKKREEELKKNHGCVIMDWPK